MSINSWLKRNTRSLKGKTVAISGPTGGLGKALCKNLAALDANIVLLDRSKEKSDALQEELKKANKDISITRIETNMEDPDSVKAAAEKLKDMPIDALICNAGAYSIPRRVTKSGYDNVFQINFVSHYVLIRELLPNLRERKGRVVAVSSIAVNYSISDANDVDFSKRSAPDNMERITTKALADSFIDEQVKLIREQVGDKKVLLALSGGVDSSVVAALLIKAIGKQLVSVHVNHGLMRKGESEQVIEIFEKGLDANLVYVDATDRFLNLLAGVSDPEKKRKIIGAEFINVFAEEASKLEGVSFLAQGTIYPDILESIKQAEGKKAVKSHHNVGGLPEDLQFELVEPLKFLYKDEVRVVGEALGLPHNMVYRQPFPGPGLGVRCLGAISRDRLEALREADAILREEFDNCGLAKTVWQYFIAVPDVKSVGVKDESRYEGWPAIIRAVNTSDAMSATIEEIPYSVLHKITERITKEVDGINRVLYDLTPKPVGTIEWE